MTETLQKAASLLAWMPTEDLETMARRGGSLWAWAEATFYVTRESVQPLLSDADKQALRIWDDQTWDQTLADFAHVAPDVGRVLTQHSAWARQQLTDVRHRLVGDETLTGPRKG